jgi:hypothetical protein
MALNPHLSDTSANAAAVAIGTLANSGQLAIYQGTQPARLAREDAARGAAIAAIRASMAPYRDDPEELWLLDLITDQEWIAAMNQGAT